MIMTDLFPQTIEAPPGVVWKCKYQRWKAFIVVDAREICLGRFHYLVSAVTVRESAEYRFSKPVTDVKDIFSL